MDVSEAALDSTVESEGGAGTWQIAELQEAVRKLQGRVEQLEGSNVELEEEVKKAGAKREELEHDLAEAVEERSKYEKMYNELLEESIKTSSRQSTKVTSEQAHLELRLAEAEAELVAMRGKVADREGLVADKRRLLDELQALAILATGSSNTSYRQQQY